METKKLFSGIPAGIIVDNPDLTRDQYLNSIGIETELCPDGHYTMKIASKYASGVIGFVNKQKCMCNLNFLLRPLNEYSVGDEISIIADKKNRDNTCWFVRENPVP